MYTFSGRWPIVVGAGFGLGMAYSNCEKDINATLTQKKLPTSKPSDKPAK